MEHLQMCRVFWHCCTCFPARKEEFTQTKIDAAWTTEISLIEPIRAQDILFVLLHDDLVANGVSDSFDLAHGGTEELFAQGSWWVGKRCILHGVAILRVGLGVRLGLGTRLTGVLWCGSIRVAGVLGSRLGIGLRLMQQRIKLSARLGSLIQVALRGGG